MSESNVDITWQDLISIKPGKVPTIGQAIFGGQATVTERAEVDGQRFTAHYSNRMNLHLVGDQHEA